MKVLFDNFDILVEAPGGIRKLRELILQLAVMGKLVPQESNDEPAAVLLEKIKAEKERLIKEGKIKRQNPLPDIKDAEKLSDLPKGWEWVRLNTICNLITDGTHHTPKYVPDGVPFLSVKDISSGEFDFSNTKYIAKKDHDALIKRCHPEYGDVLLTKVGTTGIAKAVDIQIDFSIFVSVALLKLSNKLISSDFIELFLNSPLARRYSKEGTEGVGNKNLVLKKIKVFAVPLPPLNEQKRIVAKVERLMALCDDLEKKKEKRDQKRVCLNNASLEKLLASREADEFREHWGRISENFDILYDTPRNVVKLKQAILQLAVMGKLVPQDPADEPASVLLEKIKAERERLIKEGKIKGQKLISKITDKEKPYAMPINWEWVKIGNALEMINGKAFKPADWTSTGLPIIRIQNLNNDNAIFNCCDHIIDEKYHIYDDDFLISWSGTPGTSFGAYIWQRGHAILNQHIFNCVLIGDAFMKAFLRLAVNSRLDEMIAQAHGAVGLMHITKGKLENLCIPLPPLNEQKRIVAKVERLMSLCDRLEENLKNAETKNDHLFNAVVNRFQPALSRQK